MLYCRRNKFPRHSRASQRFRLKSIVVYTAYMEVPLWKYLDSLPVQNQPTFMQTRCQVKWTRKMVCDYRRSFRHLLKDAWGDTGGRFCGRESMLFGIGRRGGSLRADVLAAVIGWIEVALLSLLPSRGYPPRYWSRHDRRLWGQFTSFLFGWVGNSVGKIIVQYKKGSRCIA